MNRPRFEVADIIRSAGADFIARNRHWLRWTHLKVLLAIARCRTAALGGHIDECTSCGHRATISYNSCRNRHCPKCQTDARERWIAARRRELLPTPYVHVVFTLPPQLAFLALQNKKLIYGLLLRASAETLLEVARNPAHFGAEIGFFSVLHTWNQKVQLHPHVHCVVPAGGLSRDHARWIRSHPRFFLPIAILRRVFRGKFIAGLKSAFERGQLHMTGELAPARPSQVLRRLAASALPQRLDRLLQTTLRRTRVCPAVSRSLYPSCRHLQPPPRRSGRRPGYLSLAGLCRPQSAESDDHLPR
jgi:Transposase zinc-binding domain/Putative transposase